MSQTSKLENGWTDPSELPSQAGYGTNLQFTYYNNFKVKSFNLCIDPHWLLLYIIPLRQ